MNYSKLKFLYISTILVFLINLVAFGQPQYQSIYQSTITNIFPLNSNSSNKAQWIYRANELTPTASAGLIDKVYFKLADGFLIDEVQIFNVLGQKMYQNTIDNKSSAILNIDKIQSGIYHILVYTNRGMMQSKFEVIK